MSSLDSSVEFTSIGEFKNQRIKFQDEELNTHYIIFKNQIIEYYKKGSMEMKFIFDLDNKTKGTYKIDNNAFAFDILTTKLENTDNTLVIEYDLIQNNEMVNRSTLVIKYSIAEEE